MAASHLYPNPLTFPSHSHWVTDVQNIPKPNEPVNVFTGIFYLPLVYILFADLVSHEIVIKRLKRKFGIDRWQSGGCS